MRPLNEDERRARLWNLKADSYWETVGYGELWDILVKDKEAGEEMRKAALNELLTRYGMVFVLRCQSQSIMAVGFFAMLVSARWVGDSWGWWVLVVVALAWGRYWVNRAERTDLPPPRE